MRKFSDLQPDDGFICNHITMRKFHPYPNTFIPLLDKNLIANAMATDKVDGRLHKYPVWIAPDRLVKPITKDESENNER